MGLPRIRDLRDLVVIVLKTASRPVGAVGETLNSSKFRLRGARHVRTCVAGCVRVCECALFGFARCVVGWMRF